METLTSLFEKMKLNNSKNINVTSEPNDLNSRQNTGMDELTELLEKLDININKKPEDVCDDIASLFADLNITDVNLNEIISVSSDADDLCYKLAYILKNRIGCRCYDFSVSHIVLPEIF